MNIKPLTADDFTRLFRLVLLFCFFAYLTGLSGPPLLDDYAYLSQSGKTASTPFINSLETPGRWLALWLFQMEAFLFNNSLFAVKAINLLLHLFNGLLIYRFSKILQQDHWRAFFAASLWVGHPLLVSTVLYAIQGATILASTFTLLGLLWYAHLTVTFSNNTRFQKIKSLFILHFLGFLAFLSKESGLLLYGYLFIFQFCFFKPDRKYHSLKWLGVYLPLLIGIVLLCFKMPTLLSFYTVRDFTLSERLLTEGFILFRYLGMIALPALSHMGFFYDAIDVVRSLDLLHSLPLIFWISLTFYSLYRHKQHPIFSFCASWFLVAHALESTILPLELAFEHRNYLALYGFTLLFSTTILHLKWLNEATRKITLIIVVLMLLTLTQMRADLWKSEQTLLPHLLNIAPDSLRINRAYAEWLFAHNEPAQALFFINQMINRYPNDPAARLQKIRIYCYMGKIITMHEWATLNQIISHVKNMNDFLLFSEKILEDVQNKQCEIQKIQPLYQTLQLAEKNIGDGTLPNSLLQARKNKIQRLKENFL